MSRHTWWGEQWLEALEERAVHDPGRLSRGRAYARQGMVESISLRPGKIMGRVLGSMPTPYKVTISIDKFDPLQWRTMLSLISGQADYSTSLLDGKLPHDLTLQARTAGLDLLPNAGDLYSSCSCPDWVEPCKHVAAVYYEMADWVDADPFNLFLLRGYDKARLLKDLRAHHNPVQTQQEAKVSAEPGIEPRAAYERELAALPAPPEPPDEPGILVMPVEPPTYSGVTAYALSELVDVAADRALKLLSNSQTPVFDLTMDEDIAARAARLDRSEFRYFALETGKTVQQLKEWADLWIIGGRSAFAVAHDQWTPPAARVAEAKKAINELGLLGTTKVSRNHVTCGDIQLRLSKHDGRWYPFAKPYETNWRLMSRGQATPIEALRKIPDLKK
jgi:uncharacterized Zn finger protein